MRAVHPKRLVGAKRFARSAVPFVVAFVFAAPAKTEEVQLIQSGDLWTYFPGVEEPDPDWFTAEYDDRRWDLGPSALGYGEAWINTMIDGMQGGGGNTGFWSLYIRSIFTIDDPSAVSKLRLFIRYDDGFVAYINGIEAARVGLPGNPGDPVPFDATATNRASENQFQSIVISNCEAIASLQAGENVIAIQGHNTSLDSSDFVLEPELFVDDADPCPTEITCEVRDNGSVRVRWTRPAGTAYTSIELSRNGVPLENQPRVTSTGYTDSEPVAGENVYTLVASVCDIACGEDGSLTCTAIIGDAPAVDFRRGDFDTDGSVNISDAISLLNHLFKSADPSPCPDASDVNDDGGINLNDPLHLLGSLFQGEAPPAPPGLETCGPDPTVDDEHTECVYGSC